MDGIDWFVKARAGLGRSARFFGTNRLTYEPKCKLDQAQINSICGVFMGGLKTVMMGALRHFGRELLSTQAYEVLERRSGELANCKPLLREYEFIRNLQPESAKKALELLPVSRSQFRQDLFVLNETGFKRGGYFVEFGATNGIDLSNTWLLEKRFGWTGIVAEPARCWQVDLHRNRTCIVDERCVWTETGRSLEFAEVAAAEFSTIRDFAGSDMHRAGRADQKSYKVDTISLGDLLREHNAPPEIDYLSIDTEGSEFDILSSFDFDLFRIGVITVEHNFTANRQKISQLLHSHGYVRKMETVSHVDDWYVLTRP